MLRRLLSALTIIILVSCQPSSSSFTKEEQQTVASNVKQTLQKYYEDIERSGLNAEFAYLDSSDDFFWVPPGYSASFPYDSVVKFIRQNASQFQKVSNSWDTLRIIPLTKELASYTGRLRSVMTDITGKTTSYTLVETGTMIKRKDGWKLLYGQTSLLATNEHE